MAAKKGPEVYRGRRRRLNVLGIVFGALAVLILLIVVLFFGLQKYIVFGHDGISVVLPGSQPASDGSGGAAGDEAPLEAVNAALEITEPDYSAVTPIAGDGLGDYIAVFVPAEDVSLSGVGRYIEVMGYYEANAVVLEVKPVSGQLVWQSSNDIAASYSTSGTVDLASLIEGLHNDEIYVVVQLSCCIDGLLAQRCPTAALTLTSGVAYSDTEGAWLNPYSDVVAQYITGLCEELISYGADELLLKSLSMPATDAPIGYTVQLSSTPSPEAAVCSLAMSVANDLAGYGVPISAILDTTGFRGGLESQTGQNTELFAKVFDRLCTATDSAWQSGVDRDALEGDFELGSAQQRYVPICNYAPDGFPTAIVRVPETVLPASDSGGDASGQ